MNVLICAARGSRLTEPLRLLPEVPPRPEYDGPPYVPHPDPEWYGSAHPGDVCTGHPDGPGCPMSAGPRDTWVVHPEDTRGRLSANPAVEEAGYCGPYETHFLPDAVRVEPAV
ncbi:hypothetical protein [Streptomyces sp. NPDC051001]|uniref:hypothetical protein n=1 Tax=Streptomyces sp. NPDC051001 TaxID=3155795 RepID=UPI00342F5501